MKSNYSLETVYQIWNDMNGSRIEVGTDKDGLDLVQIRSITAKGEKEREVTMTVDEAVMVREALGRFLSTLNPAAMFPVTIMKVMPITTMKAVEEFCKENRRIEAIKLLRAEMQWGLKEAKDWLDRVHPEGSYRKVSDTGWVDLPKR